MHQVLPLAVGGNRAGAVTLFGYRRLGNRLRSGNVGRRHPGRIRTGIGRSRSGRRSAGDAQAEETKREMSDDHDLRYDDTPKRIFLAYPEYDGAMRPPDFWAATTALALTVFARPALPMCGPITLDDAKKQAQVIFVGTVTENSGTRGTLDVRRIYKGDVGATATVRSTYTLGSAWEAGKEYLVFAESKDGELVAGSCLGTHHTEYQPESARKDWMDRLGPGTAPAKASKGCGGCATAEGPRPAAPLGLFAIGGFGLVLRRRVGR